MIDGLKAKHRAAIIATLSANARVERVVLFGSRAMGTSTVTSDVDIALFGHQLTLTDQANLAAACDELPMAQSVDLLLHNTIDNLALAKHIQTYGVEWYRRAGGGSPSEAGRAGLSAELKDAALAQQCFEPKEPGTTIQTKLKKTGAHAEWQVFRLEQLASDESGSIAIGPFGSRMKSDVYTTFGIPVIRETNISAGRGWKNSWVYVSKDFADRLPNCNAHEGDLVFSHQGLIGEVAIVPGDKPRYVISTSLIKFRPDSKKILSLFLFYYFRSDFGRNEIMRYSSQVGTPRIVQPLASLRQFQVFVPPREEQEYITEILSVLDDKIELNCKTNETLDAMARALFKSWFIDFDPVRAKAEARPTGLPADISDLFPDSFEDSELGEIPKEWSICSIEDLLTLEKDFLTPGDTSEETFSHYSIPAFDNGMLPAKETGGTIKSSKYIVSEGTFLVPKFKPRTAQAYFPSVSSNLKQICSAEFLICRPRFSVGVPFGYLLAKSSDVVQRMSALASGTSNSHQRVQPADFISLPVIKCDDRLLAFFNESVLPLLQKSLQTREENILLSKCRDILLPKLISGKIRIQDVELLIEGEVS